MPTQKERDINYLTICVHNGGAMSSDPEWRLGAAVVDSYCRYISLGYNGLPKGMPHAEHRLEKPVKHEYMVHAEVNAVINAPFSLRGGTMYVSRKPCHRCLAIAVNAGIQRVVWLRNGPPSKHCDENVFADILHSCDISVDTYDIEDLT